MFFLSKGSLRDLVGRGSLFEKASQADKSTSDHSEDDPIINLWPRPVVLRVNKIVRSPCSNKVVLQLYDGQDEYPAEVNNLENEKISPDTELERPPPPPPPNELDSKIVSGSIIILSKCSIARDGPIQIVATQLFCIGHQRVSGPHEHNPDQEESAAAVVQDQTRDDALCAAESKISVKATHMLSQVTCKLNASCWSIKARLVDKTPVKEFVNRTNGASGRFVRLQLQDSTGVVEAVAFNDLCDKLKLEELTVNKTYLVSFGEFKFSKANLRFWQSKYNVPFDLVLNKHSLFQELDEQLISDVASSEETQALNVKQQQQPQQPQKQPQKQQEQKQQHAIQHTSKYPNIYKLDRLVLKEPKCLVNVLAVVSEVGEVRKVTSKQFRKPDLSIRNITLLDQSLTPVKVALWGKQAEAFAYPVAAILYFKDIEISNYKGLSLSVTRQTGMIEIRDHDQIDIACDLREWWTQTGAHELAGTLSGVSNDMSKTKDALLNSLKRSLEEDGSDSSETKRIRP